MRLTRARDGFDPIIVIPGLDFDEDRELVILGPVSIPCEYHPVPTGHNQQPSPLPTDNSIPQGGEWRWAARDFSP